jgi:hypothetical protein
MARRRDIPTVGIEKAQHVIEGAILQHQNDDVIDRGEMTGMAP